MLIAAPWNRKILRATAVAAEERSLHQAAMGKQPHDMLPVHLQRGLLLGERKRRSRSADLVRKRENNVGQNWNFHFLLS